MINKENRFYAQIFTASLFTAQKRGTMENSGVSGVYFFNVMRCFKSFYSVEDIVW
ncbi:Uncharacterized protein dnm_093080 [Desulfonema magnum]|uniref:Uncharacterized protein n=1 Tax=Desulfonema magnum TaxID=45655 RepID=A0A975GUU8_9BACT|nr:Uncharacterized protein dnm_093080 [Desulfonema magnum]